MSYSKLIYPVGHGYDRRPDGRYPQSIVIHSTNGNRLSSFDGEARYLRDSRSVSAHYLVGKLGQLAEILPPAWRAWHAGAAIAPYYNSLSIGIECHHAIGDEWTPAQFKALTNIVRRLLCDYGMPVDNIATHRAIAIPSGRKADPSDWSDADFADWRGALLSGTIAVIRANVRTGPGLGYSVAHQMSRNEIVDASHVVRGAPVAGDTRWLALRGAPLYVHRSVVALK